MIVYEADKSQFLRDNDHKEIEHVVHDRYRAATGRRVGDSELRSWRESLRSMAIVLRDDDIPDDIRVGVEFILPQSAKRIDVSLGGYADDGSKHVVIVELKQWSQVETTPRDAIVRVQMGKRVQDAVHPSYQAWSYAAYLGGFNEAVYDGGVNLHPCAYLHNYEPDDRIASSQYLAYVEKAPLFLRGDEDRERLRAFIKQHVRRGPGRNVLFELDHGKIRPSKALADSVVQLLNGNPQFTLLDDQKAIYEAAKAACTQATTRDKRVVIVQGGPGTGKSVVAVNLLSTLRQGLVVKYVSKNAAPRDVYSNSLMQGPQNIHLATLFTGSGSFTETPPNTFDALIVDEAHRLTEKGGFYGNLGDHQVRELIRAAKCTVFFIDEDQRVTLKDIGSVDVIRSMAREIGAKVEEHELRSQFRCAGSDAYIAWLDDVLQIRPTANSSLEGSGYDVRVFDDPSEMHAAVQSMNGRNRARVVAGYCWPWRSRRRPADMDIVIGNYQRQWNLDEDGNLWIVNPRSVEQVGCIHTCQGLELDVVGVIIGPDLVMKDGELRTVARARDRYDKTMKGFVKMWREDHPAAEQLADRVIKNTYRTLMTRGMRGFYLYAVDAELRDYLRSRAEAT